MAGFLISAGSMITLAPLIAPGESSPVSVKADSASSYWRDGRWRRTPQKNSLLGFSRGNDGGGREDCRPAADSPIRDGAAAAQVRWCLCHSISCRVRDFTPGLIVR